MADLTKRKLIITEDGSHSIMAEEIAEAFHSDRGSWQESMHTYIEGGLIRFLDDHPNAKSMSIFEMGFGTGLNGLQALAASRRLKVTIEYHSVEAFPLRPSEYLNLNYADFDEILSSQDFLKLHECVWNECVEIEPNFLLHKLSGMMQKVALPGAYDVVFFDAFCPRSQPELWQAEVLQKIYDAMTYGGVLVSYSAAGVFKRSLQSAGFWIEEIRGARGKREMVRAIKM